MLSRLLRWFERRATPNPPPANAFSAAEALASPLSRTAEPGFPGFGQRRPLVDRSGALAGFELRLPATLEQRLASRAVGPAAAAHHGALLAVAAELVQARRRALMRLPAETLSRAAVQAQVQPGMWLIPDGDLAPRDTQVLRARGAWLGVTDGPPDQASPADFVLLQAVAGGLDTLLLSVQRWQQCRPRLPIAALGLHGVDEFERALGAGVTLAGGRLDAAASTARARPLQAAAHHICRLFNELALDRELGAVANAVRSDVALSYRLLRYANSPAIGLSRGVDTVEHAVMVLGRAELLRWLSVMLLSSTEGRQASPALREEALARGRLLELLARHQGHENAQALFTVGLLSRLHLLLQMPLATALEPLRLDGEARAALLHRQGTWAVYLELADALEGDDEVQFQRLCEPYGGIETVLALAGQAWSFAATLTSEPA